MSETDTETGTTTTTTTRKNATLTTGTTSPFMSPVGLDRYQDSPALWYFYQVSFWIYILGFTAAMVLVINGGVVHTYTASNPPGTLISDRFSSIRWIFSMLAMLRILVYISSSNLILYRGTTGCSFFWLFLLFVFVTMDIFSFVSLGIDYSNCNKQNQFGNPCNDPLWCCVPAIYSNLANRCNRNTPCIPAVTMDSLSSNVDFRWSFFVTLAFVVLDVLFLFIPIALWFGESPRMDDSFSSIKAAMYKTFIQKRDTSLKKKKSSHNSSSSRKRLGVVAPAMPLRLEMPPQKRRSE